MSLKSYFSGFGGWLWEEENPLRLSSFLPTTLANYYHDSAYNDDDEDGGRGLNPPNNSSSMTRNQINDTFLFQNREKVKVVGEVSEK